MRILIAEDERDLNHIVSAKLSESGYSVDSCYDGEEAMDFLSAAGYDVVILDIMMPGADGFKVLEKIRREGKITPVLFLTARDSIQDRVKGLDAGANDYLVKPFYKQELLARVKALLRRYDKLGSIRESVSDDMIRVGDIVLDTAKKQLLVRGEYIHLTATEYGILNVLMSNPGRVYSAEDIYSRVWDGESFSVENTVMVHIRRIREKFEINPKKPEHLKVIWGIGYVFE